MIECLEFNARTRLRFVNIAAIVAIGRVACERGTKESMRRCVLPPLRLNTRPLVLLVKQIIDAPRPINNIIVLSTSTTVVYYKVQLPLVVGPTFQHHQQHFHHHHHHH